MNSTDFPNSMQTLCHWGKDFFRLKWTTASFIDIIQVFKGRQGNEILFSVLVETEGRGELVTA